MSKPSDKINELAQWLKDNDHFDSWESVLHMTTDFNQQEGRIQLSRQAFEMMQRRYSVIPSKRVTFNGSIIKTLTVVGLVFSSVYDAEVIQMADEVIK